MLLHNGRKRAEYRYKRRAIKDNKRPVRDLQPYCRHKKLKEENDP